MADRIGRKEKREAKLRDIMQDASGQVVYTGDLWKTSGRQRAVLAAGLALLFAAVIGSGCIDARNAMGAFYVVLPYIGEVSALFALLWNAVKLIYSSKGVRTYVLEKSRSAIPAACRVLMVFAAAGLMLSSVYLIRNGAGGKTADSIAYLMLKAASAALAEWYRRQFTATEWETS